MCQMCLLVVDAANTSDVFVRIYNMPDMFADACTIHQNCDRIPLETFLSDQEGGKIVSSNLYNINRIFNETEKNLIQNIILSSSNYMKIRFHHTIKEFGDATGWCHSHGLAWRLL